MAVFNKFGYDEREICLIINLLVPSSDAVNKKSVSWRLSANPSVKSLGLSFDDVSLDKTTTIPGILSTLNCICSRKVISSLLVALGGLTNVTLEVFNLADSNATDVNVFIQEDVYNPSFLNLRPLGDLTFTILYNDVAIGTAHSLQTVNLNSGDNIIRMASALKPANLTVAAELMSRYVNDIPFSF